MRKLLPLFLFGLTVLILSSCSRISDVALTKRHYRSGFYLECINSKRSEAVKEPQNAPVKLTQNSGAAPALNTIKDPESGAPGLQSNRLQSNAMKKSKALEVLTAAKKIRKEPELKPMPQTKESEKAALLEGIRLEKAGYKAYREEGPPMGRLLWILLVILLFLIVLGLLGNLLGTLLYLLILVLLALLLLRLLRIL